MNFKEKKAIYLQIAERICDLILLSKYREGERIPSVREDVRRETELPPFKVMKVVEERFDSKESAVSPGERCGLYFDSIRGQNATDRLLIPESLKDFVSVGTSTDTLIFRLNLGDFCRRYMSGETAP
jgi:hypothetical protein